MQRRAANIEGYAFHAETFGGPANPAVLVVPGRPGGDYRSLLGLLAPADQYYPGMFWDNPEVTVAAVRAVLGG